MNFFVCLFKYCSTSQSLLRTSNSRSHFWPSHVNIRSKNSWQYSLNSSGNMSKPDFIYSSNGGLIQITWDILWKNGNLLSCCQIVFRRHENIIWIVLPSTLMKLKFSYLYIFFVLVLLMWNERIKIKKFNKEWKTKKKFQHINFEYQNQLHIDWTTK